MIRYDRYDMILKFRNPVPTTLHHRSFDKAKDGTSTSVNGSRARGLCHLTTSRQKFVLCSQQWASEPDDVRNSFTDKANYEQYLREEAMKQPFASKKGSSLPKQQSWLGQLFDAVSELCPKALKKISQPRLVETYRRYASSDSWSEASLGLSSADGCLRVDL